MTGGAEVGGKFSIGGVDFDYGAFINAVVAFLLTAAAIYYAVVVPINRWARRKKPDELSDELKLLTEIRDRLPGPK